MFAGFVSLFRHRTYRLLYVLSWFSSVMLSYRTSPEATQMLVTFHGIVGAEMLYKRQVNRDKEHLIHEVCSAPVVVRSWSSCGVSC